MLKWRLAWPWKNYSGRSNCYLVWQSVLMIGPLKRKELIVKINKSTWLRVHSELLIQISDSDYCSQLLTVQQNATFMLVISSIYLTALNKYFSYCQCQATMACTSYFICNPINLLTASTVMLWYWYWRKKSKMKRTWTIFICN